ncbi:unnamed protein product, partial [Mesorhabditis belari]|uniref:Uncharacterized protein n=1 Tax=Mesorhabditis belari TaxID=2138241 RepID=A0AAF3EHM5_9BILA
MLLLVFFTLIYRVQSQDKLISLTKTDGSYTMSGYQFRPYTRIIVENKDNPQGLIWVMSTVTTGTVMSQAVITDDNGNHSAVPVVDYFGSKLTLFLGVDQNRNFVISFTRTDLTTPSESPKFDAGIAPVLTSGQSNGPTGVNPLPIIWTFVPFDDERPYPAVECLVGEIHTPNCTVEMYLGGQPNEAGKGKYWLLSFTQENVQKYKTSTVYGNGVTFVVPAYCNAEYACRGKDLISKAKADENSMGFVMSLQYPGVFDTEYFSTAASITAWSWIKPSNIIFTVQSWDAGTKGYLGITIGESGIGDYHNLTGASFTPTTYTKFSDRFVSHTCLTHKPKSYYERGIRKLLVKWAEVVNNNGNYLE